MGMYDKAIHCYTQALSVCPDVLRKSSIYSAIGFTHHLKFQVGLDALCSWFSGQLCRALLVLTLSVACFSQIDQAIEFYHKALATSPVDPFTSDLLDDALKEGVSLLAPPVQPNSQ